MDETRVPHNVVPFARDAGFLRARAQDHVRAGRMLEALELYRLLAGREDANPLQRFELAVQYSDMGAYELGNRLLYELAQSGEHLAACFFTLGRNYYVQQDVRRAQDCLLTATRLEPEGHFAEECEAMLDRLDEALAGERAEDRTEKAMQRGVQALESGQSARAVRWLGYAESKGAGHPDAPALLCFAHLAGDRPAEALECARRAYRSDKHSVYALCAMACAMYAQRNPVLSAKFLDRAESEAETANEIALLCQCACEVGAHDMVLALLRVVHAEQPFAPNLLHMLAAAHWNIGQVRQALQHWATLRRLDPGNLVAWVMHERARAKIDQGEVQEPPSPEEACSYRMELSAEDSIDKLLTLQQVLRQGQDAMQARFESDAEFAAILAWGFTVQDEHESTRNAMLSLLGSLKGQRAERMLLALLTDAEQSEELKREVMGLLAKRGLCGPYYMESSGRVLRVMGQVVSPEVALPPNCERILQAAVDRLTPRYGDVVQELSRIWLPFVQRREQPGEPIKRPRVWIAALECAYRARNHRHVNLERLCARQRISLRALRRCMRMLLQNPEDSRGPKGPTDPKGPIDPSDPIDPIDPKNPKDSKDSEDSKDLPGQSGPKEDDRHAQSER